MNNKNTKHALLTSVLSLTLCGSMLVGTTFAWFTDSVSSTNNVITTGNLDVNLYYKATLDDEWVPVKEDTALFNNNTWEPGHTEVAYLKIVNEGSLALNYQLSTNIINETAGVNVYGESFKLSDYLQAGAYTVGDIPDEYLKYTAFANREGMKEYTVGKLDEAVQVCHGSGPAGNIYSTNFSLDTEDSDSQSFHVVALAVHMPETLGNEVNHNGTAPSINFGVNVVATQKVKESDGFGNDYDADAVIPDEEALIDAVGDVYLFSDLVLTSASTSLKNDITLNLMSRKITASRTASSALESSTLTVYGDVVINGPGEVANDKDYTITVGDKETAGNLTINGGTYTGMVSAVNVVNGTLIINGGFFEENSTYDGNYLINCYDTNYKNGTATVEITGGTFVNWNPAASKSENPVANFVAEGYVVLSETQANGDVWYTVVDKNDLLTLTGNVTLSSGGLFYQATGEGTYGNIIAEAGDFVINGNGNTVTMVAENINSYMEWPTGYKAPEMTNIFASKNGTVTVNDLTLTGEMTANALGWYGTQASGVNVMNNVNIIDAEVVSFSQIAVGLIVYGEAELNNCKVIGTHMSEKDVDGFDVYDLALVNSTRVTLNGGEYGSIYTWTQAGLVINGAKVDRIDAQGFRASTAETPQAKEFWIKGKSEIGTINLYDQSKDNYWEGGVTVIDADVTINRINVYDYQETSLKNIKIKVGAKIGQIFVDNVEYKLVDNGGDYYELVKKI